MSWPHSAGSAWMSPSGWPTRSGLDTAPSGTEEEPMGRFKVAMVANDLPPTPEWVGRQLAERGIDLLERTCASPADVVETAGDADAVWVMGGSRVIDAETLAHLRRCRVILRTGTATDNIPVDAATRLGLVVPN